jgi:superfamily II RNA helicase
MVENGEVWERLLLSTPATILALSATIGDFDKFTA